MPEPYWPKRKGPPYKLSDAEKHTQYARIWCRYCKRSRWYLLRELREVLGDIACDDVIDRRKIRCGGCGDKFSLDMRVENPSAADLQSVTVRRLSFRWVKRIMWHDEKL